MSAAAHVPPNVVDLGLTFQGRDVPCLKDLTVMPNLRYPTIWTTETTRFTPKQLLALRDLKQLEKLDAEEIKSLEAPQFTDADFDLMILGLPQLDEFVFDVAWGSRSTSALSSLSKHCSKLRSLELRAAYDLQTLKNIPCSPGYTASH